MSELVAVASRSFSQDKFLRNSLLSRYENVRFNDSSKSYQGEELVTFLQGASRAIIALEKIDEDILRELPSLRIISKYGVGLDNINFSALRKHNVMLAWKGGVNKRSVAELALHFILGTVRGSFHSHHEIQKNNWYQFKGKNLTAKTVGIVGLGHVGQELVKMLKPFDVKILSYDINDRSRFCLDNDILSVNSLDVLLQDSDIISLHIPHTSKTHLMIGAREIDLMKDGVFLINTARGGIVDEQALRQALHDNKIASAAFDVFNEEPLVDNELKALTNFYYTSHIGGSSIESIHAMGLAAIDGLTNGKEAWPSNFFDYEL